MKILFVCTGNICRSPTAEGVLRHYANNKITIDSAGTHGYHIGEPPDPRSIAAAKKCGIKIDELRARKLTMDDFAHFDLILACDNEHLKHIKRMAPANAKAEIALFLEYAGHPHEAEVPDPYYGDTRDFEYVLDLIEAAIHPLLTKLQPRL